MPAVSTISPLIRGDESSINAYERDLSRLFGSIRFAGISARNEDAQDAPIEKLFVEPALAEAHRAPEAFDPPEPPRAAWQPPASVTLTSALLAHQRLIILGDPGTGKSTAVHWITASLAQAVPSVLRQHLRRLGEFTAIPIILRDLPPALFTSGRNGEDLWRAVLDAWLGLPLGRWFGAAPGLLGRLTVAGRALFLIDGIDELPGLAARLALREALWWAWGNSGTCRWVATSRIVGYNEAVVDEVFEDYIAGTSLSESAKADLVRQLSEYARVPGMERNPKLQCESDEGIATRYRDELASRFYLAPFDEERVKKFAGLWFRRMIGVEEEAEKEARRFCGALAAKTDTRTLGRVPNFLTLMALIWRDRVELPDGRAKLYAQISYAYLENIDRHRFADGQRPMLLPAEATPELREKWLGTLAWHMQLRRHAAEPAEHEGKVENPSSSLTLISRTAAEKILASAVAQTVTSGDAAAIAKAFLDYAATRSGLFLLRGAGGVGGDDWGFLHLSFQEYFAACHLRERIGGDRWLRFFCYGRGTWNDSETNVDSLCSYAERRMWHETLLFLLELLSVVNPERPGTVLRALLGAPDPTEPDWPLLPEPDKVDYGGPRGLGVAMVEFLAVASVDLHVAFAPAERTALIRRCWEWELAWQELDEGETAEAISRLPALLCARRTAAELAWPWFVALFTKRKPKELRLRGVNGVEAFEEALLHPKLEEIVIWDSPALTSPLAWPRMDQLKKLVLVNCIALTALPDTLALPALKCLSLVGCSNLKRLPDLSGVPNLAELYLNGCASITTPPDLTLLPKLRYLLMNDCIGLPPGAFERLREQCRKRKIKFSSPQMEAP